MSRPNPTALAYLAGGLALLIAISLGPGRNPNHIRDPALNPSGYRPPAGHQMIVDHSRCYETNPPTYTFLRRHRYQDCL